MVTKWTIDDGPSIRADGLQELSVLGGEVKSSKFDDPLSPDEIGLRHLAPRDLHESMGAIAAARSLHRGYELQPLRWSTRSPIMEIHDNG